MRKVLRRWYWWLPTLVLAGGLGYVASRVTHPPYTRTPAWKKYQQIRAGMTWHDTKAVMDGRQPTAWQSDGEQGQAWAAEGEVLWVFLDESMHARKQCSLLADRRFSDPPDEPVWWAHWRARLGL